MNAGDGKEHACMAATGGARDGNALEALAGMVSAWFLGNGRSLPWRDGYDPYRVWISEIMLQQTRVEAVLPYYERWLARFPDPQSVAAAGEEEVLKAWEGLGYYTRARNLRRAAQEMVALYGGRVPGTLAELRSLPGIGRYSAGAIASIAFGTAAPAVDGNTGRLLGRLFALDAPARSAQGQARLWSLAEAMVAAAGAFPGGPRALNQGLMELGALICLPRAPRCGECPVAERCLALRAGAPERFPPALPRRERPLRRGVLLLARNGSGRRLLRKRPPQGLWGGLWEPPWTELEGGETPDTAVERLRGSLSLSAAVEPLGALRHGLTHFELALDCYALQEERRKGAPRPPPRHRWVGQEELASLPLARLGRRAFAMERRHPSGGAFPARGGGTASRPSRKTE